MNGEEDKDMNGITLFLVFNALAWLPYGLFCMVAPTYLQEIAGLAATTPTALTEVRAMYGGLQAAIGALALYGVLRPAQRPAALLALAFLFAGLASVRVAGALIDGGVGGYTWMALGFETFSLAWAVLLLTCQASTKPA